MHLREADSKHLGLMSSFIFIVTFYVLILSHIIPWCSHSRKQFDLEEDSFAFTSISFVVCEGRLSAYLHFLGMGIIPFFSRLWFFSFVNCCLLFLLIPDVTNSTEINANTLRINVCVYIIMLDSRSSNYNMNALSNGCFSLVISSSFLITDEKI